MKRTLFFGFLAVALARAGLADPTAVWINNGTTNCPPSPIPQIDATNVINNGQLNIVFTNLASPFDFSDALNFTNRGIFSCIGPAGGGFIFNTQPSGTGDAHRAALFGNASVGQVLAGAGVIATTVATTGTLLSVFSPVLTIQATNIVNAGNLEAGENGVLTLDGSSVDLTRSTNTIDGLQVFGASLGVGLFEDYWGLGRQTNAIGVGIDLLPSPAAPLHTVTNVVLQTVMTSFVLQNATAGVNITTINASNINTEAVFVGNTNPAVAVDIRFEPTGDDTSVAYPVIQWLATPTNTFGVVTTNTIYLSDSFGAFTNFALFTNSTSQAGVSLLLPTNFTFSTTFPLYTSLPEGNTPFNPALIPLGGKITNQYSAVGVTAQGITFRPDPSLPGQTLTNIPGRMVIIADQLLNLTRTVINGPNYLNLVATNHFKGSANAQISAPNMDINLGTTNGILSVSNLVAANLPTFNGPITAYSARWTNIVNGFTNSYHILVVNSQLNSTTLPLVQNITLRSTNVVISDVLNIASNLLINATTLTITSNSPGPGNPVGELNLLNLSILWQSSLPTLQFLTNFGIINTPNTAYFAQSSQPPVFTGTFSNGYQTFVNHGSIISAGDTIIASAFTNTGIPGLVIPNPLASGIFPTTNTALILSTFGPITLQASNAVLTSDFVVTEFGDVTLIATNLTVSNHLFEVGGALTMSVASNLTDGGALSGNSWFVTDGFNLLQKPAQGDFLGTTVTLTAPAEQEVDNTWAGLDFGRLVMGFSNNAALGHLILSGGDNNSAFHFGGPEGTTNYALYVDLLDLQNGATNRISQTVNGTQVQVFSAFDIDPNVKIYFADAVIGQSGADISEKLNGANGGQLIWVPAYAGIFSGTNIVNGSGQLVFTNRALATSSDLNPAQILALTAQSLPVTVTTTNLPPETPVISWLTVPDSTNILRFLSSLTSSNSVVVTNFIATNGNPNFNAMTRMARVVDKGRTNAVGFYKVTVEPALP